MDQFISWILVAFGILGKVFINRAYFDGFNRLLLI